MEEKKLHIGEGKREAGTAPTNLRAVLKGDTVSMAVADAISEALGYKTEQLFSLSKDSSPFSSTIVPLEHLHSDTSVSSVMIEVNRRLYMTPDGSKTDSFSDIQRMLAALVGEIEML